MKSRWCALGLFLLLFPATARAGDRHAKTAAEAAARVIADIRARISLNDLKQWWDGEAVASRVFSDSWDSLPPAVRAELEIGRAHV